ncbi:MAG: hypothetical protein AAGU19_03840 [Prolixibacteraceae bacterium]
MGKIDRSNYEIHFIDYIDGNLAVDRIDEFLEFLDKNPDLKEELQIAGQNAIRLPDEKTEYNGKDSLLKDELTGCTFFDYRAIASIEGDLTDDERSAFAEELRENVQKQKDFNLMKRLRLRPQPTISFPDKSSLLKNSRPAVVIWSARIAAILVLGLLIWTTFPDGRQQPAPQQTNAISANKESGPGFQKPLGTEQKEQSLPEKVLLKPSTGSPHHFPEKTIPRKEPADRPREAEIMAELAPRELIPFAPAPVETKTKLTARTGESREKAEYTKLTDYIAQKLLDIPKDEDVTLASLAGAGLRIAGEVSGNRLSVEKSDEGKISEISLNTRLIGFSIPIKKNR